MYPNCNYILSNQSYLKLAVHKFIPFVLGFKLYEDKLCIKYFSPPYAQTILTRMKSADEPSK